MKIKTQHRGGFTLVEVVVASAIAALLFAGIFQCFNVVARRTQFAAYDMAANACAVQQLEQVFSAQWVPSSGITTLLTAYPTQVVTSLYMPNASGGPSLCTNVITVNKISDNPPYAMIQVSCVWGFVDMGTFTNTVSVLRAPQ